MCKRLCFLWLVKELEMEGPHATEEEMWCMKKDKRIERDPMQEVLTFTLGELFPDGAAIELLQDHRLVLRCDGNETIGTTIEHAGRKYVAAPLAPKWVQMMRLPVATAEFGTAEVLMRELSRAIAPWVPIDESSLLLVTAFILATWTLESLPALPCLNLWGSAGVESSAVDVIAGLCRRALSFDKLAHRELCKVPAGVCTTVVHRQPSLRSLQQFLNAGTETAPNLLVGGAPHHLRFGLLTTSLEPFPLPILNIQVLSARTAYDRLTSRALDSLRERFFPQLACYRLMRHGAISESQFDAPSFEYCMRTVARTCSATAEGEPELQRRIVAVMADADESNKVERSQDTAAVVIETILAVSHEPRRKKIQVEDLADLVNVAFKGRHKMMDLTPEEVGIIIHKKLGLATKRQGPGSFLKFDHGTCARVHRLAAEHQVLTLLAPSTNSCPWCEELVSAEKKQVACASVLALADSFAADLHNIHNIHNIHNLRDVHGGHSSQDSEIGVTESSIDKRAELAPQGAAL
jgi:hypothetical protein